MRALTLPIALVCVTVLATGCPLAGPPDLVATLAITGAPTVSGTGDILVPVEVAVTNQGRGPADIFKVSIEYTTVPGSPRPTFAPFTVPGQSDTTFPYTSAPLAAWDSATFTGVVKFVTPGATVALFARADSCAGEMFMPAECHVIESDETNNTSASETIVLP